MTGLWNKIIEKKDVFLKGFLVLALFFPAFYSPFEAGYMGMYYVGFYWPYLLLAIYMGLSLQKRREKKNDWFLWGFLALVILYQALALYFDVKYLQWYWEAINNTLSFLFLGLLIYKQQEYEDKAPAIMRFAIICIGGSTLLSVLYHFTGYTGLCFCNNQIVPYKETITYESRNYWIYSHKSDYALMLIAFLAMVLRWRGAFTGKLRWIGWAVLGLLAAAMWQTHSWTGIVGALLVLVGFALDRVNWKAIKAWYFAVAGVLGAAGAVVVYRIAMERDVLSLGGRVYIWNGAFDVIRKYPQGWGMRFGNSMFFANPEWMVNNAHNVFLNAVLRFSIPVGITFTLIFAAIILYTLWKSRDFLAVGMWAGILMLMTMDYALLNFEVAMVLFCVYFVCVCKPERRKKRV